LRESANPAMSSSGYTYKYDVSLPIRDFEDFISDMKRHLRSLSLLHGNWGHILDGNLHFNVCRPSVFEPDPLVLSQLEPYLFEQVIGRGGSISAEHGLGQSKNEYLGMVHAPATLDLMRDIKQLLDPNTILNPGKYFPTTNKEGD
jgi:FAD/FMN-containing dehydrogenase